MNLADDRFRLHAYVDDELAPDDAADVERLLAQDPAALAEVAALRAQKTALHERYDEFLTARPEPFVRHLRPRWFAPFEMSWDGANRWALAATLVLSVGGGLSAGWIARGQADARHTLAGRADASAEASREVEGRLQAFVDVATLSHAVFVPEIRHPVEVAAADEAHLVAWLSKRLDAPLVVPHLGDAGWNLLGGRLLPAPGGPVAQFMYQDPGGRRMTLAVSRSVSGPAMKPAAAARPGATAVPVGQAAFRIAEENGSTVFYWIDADYAYALTGRLTRTEMTALASRVYRQLDR